MAKELQAQTNQTTGTIYARLWNVTSQYWYTVTPAFEAFNAAHITSYALTGSQDSTTGKWTADMPAAVTVGVYYYCFFLQGGGSPAVGDVAISTVGSIDYTGTVTSAAVAYLPQAQAGAANGVLIAGSNAATTFSGLTTGALSCTTITASGAVAFQSTFAVTGTTTLTGAVSANGGVTFTSATGDAFTCSSTGGNGNGISVSGNGTGASLLTGRIQVAGAITITGPVLASGGVTFSSTSGNGFTCSSTGNNGNGFATSGNGSGDGWQTTAGITGRGVHSIGGSTSGEAFFGETTNGDAFSMSAGGASHIGILGQGGTGSGHGIQGKGGGNGNGINGIGAGSGDGVAGTGGLTGRGGHFVGGATSGAGLRCEASSGGSPGIHGVGNAAGAGGQFDGGASGVGLDANPFAETYTMAQWARLLGAVICGTASGGPSGTVFNNMGGSTARVTTTDDTSGNRTAVTLIP